MPRDLERTPTAKLFEALECDLHYYYWAASVILKDGLGGSALNDH